MSDENQTTTILQVEEEHFGPDPSGQAKHRRMQENECERFHTKIREEEDKEEQIEDK